MIELEKAMLLYNLNGKMISVEHGTGRYKDYRMSVGACFLLILKKASCLLACGLIAIVRDGVDGASVMKALANIESMEFPEDVFK